jgi:hypothetical protein
MLAMGGTVGGFRLPDIQAAAPPALEWRVLKSLADRK